MTVYEISVIIAVYNPSWTKLKATLYSIIKQKNISFQIIIADDGSEASCEEQCSKFMIENLFKDYIYIRSDQNRGTVGSIYCALKMCEGKYIKTMGQSDLLYDETVLRRMLDYTVNNDFKGIAGLYKAFKIINGKPTLIRSIRAPQRLDCFSDKNKAIINYVICEDAVNGTTLFIEKECMRHYLAMIRDRIRLCEDVIFRLMILDGVKVGICDFAVTYYEVGAGVSTSGKQSYNKNILSDAIEYNVIAQEISRENKRMSCELACFFKARVRMLKRYNKVNVLRWLLSNPYKLQAWISSKTSPVYTDSVMENDFFESCFKGA